MEEIKVKYCNIHCSQDCGECWCFSCNHHNEMAIIDEPKITSEKIDTMLKNLIEGKLSIDQIVNKYCKYNTTELKNKIITGLKTFNLEYETWKQELINN